MELGMEVQGLQEVQQPQLLVEDGAMVRNRRGSESSSTTSNSDHARFEELLPCMMDGQITGNHDNEVDGELTLHEHQMRSKSHTYAFTAPYHDPEPQEDDLSALNVSGTPQRQGSMKFGKPGKQPQGSSSPPREVKIAKKRSIKEIEFEQNPNDPPAVAAFGRGATGASRRADLKNKFRVAGKAMMCIGEYSIRRAVAKDLVAKGKAYAT